MIDYTKIKDILTDIQYSYRDYLSTITIEELTQFSDSVYIVKFSTRINLYDDKWFYQTETIKIVITPIFYMILEDHYNILIIRNQNRRYITIAKNE